MNIKNIPKEIYNDYRISFYLEEKSKIKCRITFIPYLLKYFINTLICKILGHKLVSNSYANTETGCESICCERCSCSWNVILY